MKSKLFIVTYNNAEDLDACLNSIYNKVEVPDEIYVINNHSSISINKDYIDSGLIVLNNVLRPDFSTGHLSRNWNQALINGFKDVNKPDSDIVMTCQDDTIFEEGWLDFIKENHQKYSFMTFGVGDAFCSYTIDAVKSIGLWDERFCNIGYHEIDYFLRAHIFNRDKSSINDIHFGINFLDGNYYNHELHIDGHGGNKNVLKVPAKNTDRLNNHNLSKSVAHNHSEKMFNYKWPEVPISHSWREFNLTHLRPKDQFITYPYFELKIENLKDKGYIV